MARTKQVARKSVAAKSAAKKTSVKAKKCIGTTKEGKKCSKLAIKGMDVCAVHTKSVTTKSSKKTVKKSSAKTQVKKLGTAVKVSKIKPKYFYLVINDHGEYFAFGPAEEREMIVKFEDHFLKNKDFYAIKTSMIDIRKELIERRGVYVSDIDYWLVPAKISASDYKGFVDMGKDIAEQDLRREVTKGKIKTRSDAMTYLKNSENFHLDGHDINDIPDKLVEDGWLEDDVEVEDF